MAIDRLEADATRLLIDDHGRLTSVYAIAMVRRQAGLALEQARIAEENSKL